MGATLRDSLQTTATGNTARGTRSGVAVGFFFVPFGNRVSVYYIEDPDNIVAGIINGSAGGSVELDFSTYWSAHTAIDQVNVQIVGVIIANTTAGDLGVLGIVNYDPAGTCYLIPYTQTTGAPDIDIGQLEAYTMGVNATNTEVNQAIIIGSYPACFTVLVFNDELQFVRGDGIGGFDNPLNLTVASTPGNKAHGVVASASVLYATGLLDAELVAWTITDATVPTLTPLFTVPTGGDEARNVYVNASVVAVIVIDGADSKVELFDPADGSSVGTYLNGSGGTITDLYFDGTCMYVVTDATTSNLHSVDISTPASPVLNGTSTIPGSSVGLANIGISNTVLDNPIVVAGNVSPSGESAFATITLDGCAGGGGASGSLCLYALGSRLYVGDDTPQLEVFDITNPASPSSLGTLALEDTPTDIWVNESNCYISFHGGFYMVNIDDPALMTSRRVETGDDFDFVTAPGGLVYLSGVAARLAVYNPANTPPSLITEREIISGGVSRVAVEGTRVFFCDTAPTGAAVLYSYGVGGFTCHAIAAGVMSTDEIQVEEIYARHGHFKGDLAARSLLLTGMLATTGIIFVDVDDGSLQLVQVDGGAVTVTAL
jgi:hypothetical protein